MRYLYQQVYLPLLACHERQYVACLTQAARQHGGLIIGLDGLAPEGGEPQLWFIRELLSGLTLRSGWLSRFDQATFEAFLEPLSELAWPILAVLSDKQKGLPEAVTTVLPEARHHFCHSHYLKNLAEPLAEADSAFNVELRKAVRAEVGLLIRAEQASPTPPPTVLTVTGLLPDPPQTPPEPQGPSTEPVASDGAHALPPSDGAMADAVVTQLLRHTRYLLTLKGRPPFRLAGIEAYQRLQGVVVLSQELLAHRHDPRLAGLCGGRQTALAPFAPEYHELRQGETWLHDIDRILEPSEPRTNNDLESHFRDTQRRLLRTTGQKGQTRRALQRIGAWELLPRPPTEARCLAALREVPTDQLAEEQDRLRQHQERFCLHTRSIRRVNAQFDKLREQWLALAATSTG